MFWKMVVFVAVATLTKVLASAHTSNAPLVGGGLGDDGIKNRLKDDSYFHNIPQHYLGGGFQIYTLFSPLLGEMILFDKYFSDGLKPPTRNRMWESLFSNREDIYIIRLEFLSHFFGLLYWTEKDDRSIWVNFGDLTARGFVLWRVFFGENLYIHLEALVSGNWGG